MSQLFSNGMLESDQKQLTLKIDASGTVIVHLKNNFFLSDDDNICENNLGDLNITFFFLFLYF